MDLATLLLKVDSTQVAQGTQNLDRLATAADKAHTAQEKLTLGAFLNASALDKSTVSAVAAQRSIGKITFDPRLAANSDSIRDSLKDLFSEIDKSKDGVARLIAQERDLAGASGSAGDALGTLLGRIGPLTIGLGAAASAAAVYYKVVLEAERETFALHKALLLGGNAAGLTATQLQQMAVNLDRLDTTQAKATATLVQFAQGGKVAAKNLQEFAGIAIGLERSVGIPVANTVRQFEELAKSPVAASRRLNEEYHYLSRSVLEQISALEKQGSTQAAVELAQKSFADAMKQRAGDIEQHLGTLQRLARGTTELFSEMWDSVLNIGREGSARDKLVSQLRDAQRELQRISEDQGLFDKVLYERAQQRVADLEKRLERVRVSAGDQKLIPAGESPVKASGDVRGGVFRPTSTGIDLEVQRASETAGRVRDLIDLTSKAGATAKFNYMVANQEFEKGARWLEEQVEATKELNKQLTEVSVTAKYSFRPFFEDGKSLDDVRQSNEFKNNPSAQANSSQLYQQWLQFQQEKTNAGTKATDKLNEYEIQAARSTQQIIANTITSGFDGGIKGIISSFGKMLLQLEAQALAAKISEKLLSKAGDGGSGSTGWLSGVMKIVFGGNKASGGPLEQGKWYIAGEHGPEPIWGGGAGAHAVGYAQQAAMARPTVVVQSTNHFAAGLNVAEISTLQDQRDAALETKIVEGLRRNRYAELRSN